MKTLYVIAMILSLTGSVYADGGGAASHGGDTLVSEFTGSARNIAKAIQRLGNPSACIGSDELNKVISETRVYSSPIVMIEGREHDARNNSAKKEIELSRVRIVTEKDTRNYLSLVVHEYLGVLGREETNTTDLSRACIAELATRGIDLEKLRYRTSPITSFEKYMLMGKGRLDCRTAKGQEITVLMTELKPNRAWQQLPDISRSFHSQDLYINILNPNGSLYGQYHRFVVERGPNSCYTDNFRVEYSIATGKAKWVFSEEYMNRSVHFYNLPELREVRISTEDHVVWDLKISPRFNSDPLVQAKCNFSLVE